MTMSGKTDAAGLARQEDQELTEIAQIAPGSTEKVRELLVNPTVPPALQEAFKAAADSVAATCIFPLQDILHLGTEARMNRPAAAVGNWTWRFHLDALHPDLATQLAAVMEMTDRDGYQQPTEGITAGGPTDEASLRVREGSQS